MRYLIMHGSFPSELMLPARATMEEAQGEVVRLEALRAIKNKRAAAYAALPKEEKYRGGAFLVRSDEDAWSVREIA